MEKIDKNIIHSWTITLLVSPIFFIFLFHLDSGLHRIEAQDIFIFYFLFVLIGTFCAIPTLVFFILISHFCKNYRYWNKVSISLTATACIFLTFMVIDMYSISDSYIKASALPLIYSVIFIIALYKSNNLCNSIQKLKNKH